MSNPQNPYEPSDGLPRYGATNHPEDQPGFGSATPNTPNYGGYEAYGAGFEPLHDSNVAAGTVPADGKVHAIDAISWAFRTVFSNAKLWILGTVAFFIVFGILSAILNVLFPTSASTAAAGDASLTFTTNDWINQVATSVVSAIVAPFLTRLALHQIDDPTTGWGHIGKDVHFVPALAVSFIVGIVTSAIMGLMAFGMLGGALETVASSSFDPNNFTQEEALALVTKLLGAVLVILLVSLLTYPLYMLMAYPATEGRAGVGGSIAMGFKAGLKHYFPLLGFIILLFLIVVFGSILTLFLGLIILTPMALLSTAHVYRQATGGMVPVSRAR